MICCLQIVITTHKLASECTSYKKQGTRKIMSISLQQKAIVYIFLVIAVANLI